MKQKQQTGQLSTVQRIVYMCLLFLLVGLVVSQRHDLAQALHSAANASPYWLLAAAAAMALSLPCTALIYRLLTPVRLPFDELLLVQTAGLFVNKVVPSGAGAAGVSFLYLRSRRLRALTAGVIVALNNVLGFVGHMLLLTAVLITLKLQGTGLPPEVARRLVSFPDRTIVLAVGLVAVVLLIIARRQWTRMAAEARKELGRLLRRPQIAVALLVSIALTSCYVAALWTAAAAVGLQVSMIEVLLVLTLSVGATAVVPVPGGVGAAEAGVYLGLRAFDVASGQALLVAITYRLMTFWLPLLVGAIAMFFVGRHRLLQTKK